MMPGKPIFSGEHEALRGGARRFVECEFRPYVNYSESEGAFPRALYRKTAVAGLWGAGYDEKLGGIPADFLPDSSFGKGWQTVTDAAVQIFGGYGHMR